MSLRWLDTALDLLYPRACVACGAPDPSPRRHLCWDCAAAVPVIQPPYCSLCGDPVSGRIDHEYVCALCSSRPVHFDLARSAARYDGALAAAIQELKYRGGLWLADDLADLLVATVETHLPGGPFDDVAAVPLHAVRRRERGYNQAGLLASALARRIGRPVLHGALRRVRPTPTQTRLTVLQRAANVQNAFEPARRRWMEGRRILLVDDVMTTGATVNECARALKSGGAARVFVVTVARG
jgi:ComF family protein